MYTLCENLTKKTTTTDELEFNKLIKQRGEKKFKILLFDYMKSFSSPETKTGILLLSLKEEIRGEMKTGLVKIKKKRMKCFKLEMTVKILST